MSIPVLVGCRLTGVQSFGHALSFMNEAALAELDTVEGFQIGEGPGVAVLDEGLAQTLTTTTLRDDVFAFVFARRCLRAGSGLEGSKITRINP